MKLLATVDLGPEIEGMAGSQLRTRTVTTGRYVSRKNGEFYVNHHPVYRCRLYLNALEVQPDVLTN